MIFKKRPIFNLKTSLENIPTEWLRNIEPKVQRGAWLPCWIWTGLVDPNGYPIMSAKQANGRRTYVMVHRVVAKMFYGFDDSCIVRRTCKTVNCVNPAHVMPTNRHHKQGY